MYSPLQSPPPGRGSPGLSCSAPALAGTWHSSVGGHRAQATKPAPGGDKEPASDPAVQPSKAQPPEAAPTPPAAALGDLGQRTQQTGGRAPLEARREHSALDPTTTPGGEAPGARPASATAPQQDCWPGQLATAPPGSGGLRRLTLSPASVPLAVRRWPPALRSFLPQALRRTAAMGHGRPLHQGGSALAVRSEAGQLWLNFVFMAKINLVLTQQPAPPPPPWEDWKINLIFQQNPQITPTVFLARAHTHTRTHAHGPLRHPGSPCGAPALSTHLSEGKPVSPLLLACLQPLPPLRLLRFLKEPLNRPLLHPLCSEWSATVGHTGPRLLRPCPHCRPPLGPQPSALSPHCMAGPAQHAVGAQTVLGWRRGRRTGPVCRAPAPTGPQPLAGASRREGRAHSHMAEII